MQKAYIGKETNSISQLIPDTYERFESYDNETFGDRYYLIEIPDGEELPHPNYFYNSYEETFEEIEGITIEDHKAEVEPSRVELLEEENRMLRDRLLAIEQKLGL